MKIFGLPWSKKEERALTKQIEASGHRMPKYAYGDNRVLKVTAWFLGMWETKQSDMKYSRKFVVILNQNLSHDEIKKRLERGFKDE